MQMNMRPHIKKFIREMCQKGCDKCIHYNDYGKIASIKIGKCKILNQDLYNMEPICKRILFQPISSD
jgi:hypothetical protein